MRGKIAIWMLAGVAACGAARGGSLEEAVAAVRAVGPEGAGNVEATRAWRDLARARAADLPGLLGAFDGANDLAANWLRAAVESVAEREARAGAAMPADALVAHLNDLGRDPRGRRLAYEILARVAPARAAGLLPGMLEDPSLELRRDAVGLLVAEGDRLSGAGDAAGAGRLYREALGHARDADQIRHLSDALEKMGTPVDLPRHFGFLMEWDVIGPFDNAGRKGFDAVYPPERGIDLGAELPGKGGAVRWKRFRSAQPYGTVDINAVLGSLKEVTAYAHAEFRSGEARPAELRLGCKNAWKIWFNGRLLFARDEYHRGSRMDQYRLPVDLVAGPNRILIKLCQNEQTETWTKEWEFQLRVCDASGKAILAADAAR